MKNKVQGVVSIVMSMIFLISVAVGYFPMPQYVVELTFMSNLCTGIMLFVSGIALLRNKKNVSVLAVRSATVTLMLVFLTCMGSLSGKYSMNFKGAFFVLHVITPLLILAYYLIFVNEKTEKKNTLLLTPMPAVLYLIFDYVLGLVRGNFVYGFFKVAELPYIKAIIVGACAYLLLVAISIPITTANMIINRKAVVID